MDFKNIFKYHKMVLCISSRETINDLFGEIKNLVGDFTIAIASGLAYAILSYFRQGAMIDWLGVVVSVVCGFVAWGIVLFLCNLFWKVPAKLYREKEGQALKRTWNDIKIKELNFTDSNWLGVGFSIISDKPKEDEFYVPYFYPKIKKIVHGNEIIYEENRYKIGIELPIIIKKPEFDLFHHGGQHHIPNRIDLDEPIVAVHVAKYENKKALIKGIIEEESKQPSKYEKEIDLPCQVIIEMRGTVGKPLFASSLEMDICLIDCEINEDAGSGLKIKMEKKVT